MRISQAPPESCTNVTTLDVNTSVRGPEIFVVIFSLVTSTKLRILEWFLFSQRILSSTSSRSLMEGNFKEIQDSMKNFEEFYKVMEVELDDKNGNKMTSSLALVKKPPKLIQTIIRETNIKNQLE